MYRPESQPEGRIVIPAEFRRELEADVGDEVILRLVGGQIHILTRSQAIRKAQALVCNSVPTGRSLVKELLQERRVNRKDKRRMSIRGGK